MLLLDFSLYSTLLLDLSIWSKDTLNFENLSSRLNLLSWNFSFSGLSVLRLGFSLRSVLLRGASKLSGLSILLLEMFLWEGDFSTAATNFFKCLIYSGYNSRLQWLPPFSHKGSYFAWHCSQSSLPWEQSTTSSAVPCTMPREKLN